MRNNKKKKFVVLLSAGLDSTVNLKLATIKGEVSLAITFDYGQIAREQEIKRSALICDKLGVQHKVLELLWFREITKSGLISGNVPKISDVKEIGENSMKSVWVPARNLVFVSVAVAYAEAIEANEVVCGFNKEEGETFPDNSPNFVSAMNSLLKYASLKDISIVSFTQDMAKWEIAKLGWEIDAPLQYCWPCYLGGKEICGECESCLRFLNALKKSGLYDKWREQRRVENSHS